jgi:hypothetical protein
LFDLDQNKIIDDENEGETPEYANNANEEEEEVDDEENGDLIISRTLIPISSLRMPMKPMALKKASSLTAMMSLTYSLMTRAAAL